jgi:hypothetical protein
MVNVQILRKSEPQNVTCVTLGCCVSREPPIGRLGSDTGECGVLNTSLRSADNRCAIVSRSILANRLQKLKDGRCRGKRRKRTNTNELVHPLAAAAA